MLRSLALASLLVAVSPGCWAGSYRVIDLGVLPTHVTKGVGYDINENGTAVGHLQDASSANLAFRWDSTHGMQSLDPPAGRQSIAFGINATGYVVGRTQVSGGSGDHRPVRWDAGGALEELGRLNDNGTGTAYGINASGQMAGNCLPVGAPGQKAVRWGSDKSVAALTTLGGSQSQAYGINDSGQVAGFSNLTGDANAHAVRWSADGTPQDLGSLGGGSQGIGINATGEVAGVSGLTDGSASHAVWWDVTGVIHDIGTLGGTVGEARDINGGRQVVGTSTTAAGSTHAFLWGEDVLYDLNDLVDSASADWELQAALGINDGGWIVGWGVNPSGQDRAFLAVSPPPSLDWAGTAGYEGDGVAPDSGAPSDTEFTFAVEYADVRGDDPTRAQCAVQCRRDGEWTLVKRLNLTKASGSVEMGAVYSAACKLPNWAFRYRFRFTDSYGDPVTLGDPCARLWRGPVIVSQPKVCWTGNADYEDDGVDPGSGQAGDGFRFEVLYMDSAGDQPDVHEVLIKKNGVFCKRRSMTRAPGGSYTDGMVYERTVTLAGPGTYEYKFRFADASGTAAGDPARWSGPLTVTAGGSGDIMATVAAFPTPAGAQLTFSLSSSASVSARVLNLAGRPVRALCTARDCDAGTNTLLWNAKSDRGLTAPNGVYLLEVEARTDDGGEARALAQLRLAR